MTSKVTFNGKFFSARPTGVHRVAEELIAACDAYASEVADGKFKFTLIARHNVKIPCYKNIRIIRESNAVRWMHRIAWEQIYIPFVRRKDIILNLCNIGPLMPCRSITMIHDAQVYSTPTSYDFLFRVWYKFIMPLIGRRHRIILTVSEYSKREIQQYGIAKPEKILVVYNGCDHILRLTPDKSIVEKLGAVPNNYVVALSNTQKHKNISVLLKAFRAPELKDHELILFGGASRADFERLGEIVPDNVKFAGRLSDNELAGLMESAGALAFPSLTEGFGLPPLEAMALGCPVVAAPCGALPEVCENAVLYADPCQPEAWASKIKLALDDPHIRRELREKGYNQAAKFTWRRAASEILDVVQSISGARCRKT